jgi:hypothetical protein
MRSTKIFATGLVAAAICVAGALPAAAGDSANNSANNPVNNSANDSANDSATTKVTLGPDGTLNRTRVLSDGTVSGYTDCTATNKFVAIRVRWVDAWPLRIATYSSEIGQRNYEFPAGAGVIEVDRTQATWHHSATWSITAVGGPDGAFTGWEGLCV